MAASTLHANNTMKTRTQLKRDTEANWNKAGPKQNSPGFVPLEGELIIYLPDATHEYSRLKVGDGSTNVVQLPFIDSGTVNGEVITNEIVTFSGSNFPANGDSTKLYVSATNNAIYYYNGTNYVKLSNYSYTFTNGAASNISQWSSGRQATFSVTGGTFSITSGTAPSLQYTNDLYLKTATKESGN